MTTYIFCSTDLFNNTNPYTAYSSFKDSYKSTAQYDHNIQYSLILICFDNILTYGVPEYFPASIYTLKVH